MWPFPLPNYPPPNHIHHPPFFPFSCSSPISNYPNLKTLSSLCFFMAESFHLPHVPHQSGRDKLRVTPTAPSHFPFQPFNPNHHHQPPFYDPFLHLDLLTCGFHPQSSQLSASSEPTNANPPSNFMGFLGNPRNQGLSLSLSSETHIPMKLNFHHLAPGPFTGYASVLKTSMFLRPAQQLLQEICDASGFISLDSSGSENLTGLDDTVERESDGIGAKSNLISMLDEVYKKYKIYSHQLQAVVTSFESIPGLNDAAPFANSALKALSKHFKSLKSAITDQLQFISKAPGSLSGRKHGYSGLGGNDKFALCSQSPVHNNARIVDNHPVWRPHRGLPERAVSVLRSWLFEHFLHPYPTDTDKLMLAKQTGLSRSQVSNWFINARVRLWKPMVEEIHALESCQQAHKKASSSQTAPPRSNERDTFAAPPNSLAPGHTHANPFSSLSAPPDNPPEKHLRNDLVDLQYGHFNSGVSLTLALHHNNGMSGLLEPFPVARHYGFPSDHDAFGVQNQRFGGGSSCRSAMG